MRESTLLFIDASYCQTVLICRFFLVTSHGSSALPTEARSNLGIGEIAFLKAGFPREDQRDKGATQYCPISYCGRAFPAEIKR